MLATIKTPNVQNTTDQARKARDNQALIEEYAVFAPRADGIALLVTCRLYMSTARDASRVTAIIWVGGAHGSGWAGGYGYHKQSAAVSAAIASAGFELDQDIAGRGDSAISEALCAVAVAVYPDVDPAKLYVHRAHN